MADWRQIQARIRKAKVGSDPPGQLAALYEKTRDAMVAFELAQWHEKAGQNAEAARWYTTAAERFRRAQWKVKAEQALARLGVSVPEAEHTPPDPPSEPGMELTETGPGQEQVLAVEQTLEPSNAHEALPQASSVGPARNPSRRRGRRGGRRHRDRPGEQSQAAVHSLPVAAEPSRPTPQPPRQPYRDEHPETVPRVSGGAEPALAPPERQARARTGEPALVSRVSHLESQLRRLLASQEFRPDQADLAPAGPGVFLLSDSDMTTHYHVEACQTLRIGISNLLRGDRSGRGGSFKSRLAEHLEISDARVAKYLKEHCVVRWLQLDDGATFLAHFAISVLRPVLND